VRNNGYDLERISFIFLNAVYADGMANAKNVEKLINTAPAASKAPDPSPKATDPSSKAPEIDLEKLREEIATIKGIGENRLNEIMSVVGKYTAK
jgi:predicted flap endonuclease-1-like 5' DNA nuclease